MARAFHQARDHVLKSFYYYILKSNRFAYLNAEEMIPIVGDMSSAHIYLIMKALEDDQFLECEEDENTGGEIFRLNARGMMGAEQAILDGGQSLDEFEQSFYANIPDEMPVQIRSDDADILQVKATLDELAVHLEKANDIGELSELEKDAATAEVRGIRTELDGKQLRPATFVGRVEETLGWIIKKAGETTVSELAKKALELILKYFGIL